MKPKTASVLWLLGVCNLCAAQFDSRNMDLLSHLPLAAFGTDYVNDIWGWTDPLTGGEYALIGLSDGTAFVDVSNPSQPAYLGKLPTHTSTSNFRDIKVYNNHAYVVSDDNGPHGMQIFDLTGLRGVTSPQTFAATSHSDLFRSAHNIAINEDTGYAYVPMTDVSAGALVLNLANPTAPQMAGVLPGGNSHDLQSVIYSGPDSTYFGREIVFSANVGNIAIVDASNKSSMNVLSSSAYPGIQYAHQGWLSEDQTMFFSNDELDDVWTHIWDVSDLNNPQYVGAVDETIDASDHNHYVKGGLLYSANYSAGLRVFSLADAENGDLTEVAYIDTFPEFDAPGFRGAWSVYPFFDSGTIITSDTNNGLFVTRLNLGRGDFNNDGNYDCADIDPLIATIATGSASPQYDLNDDGQVNLADRDLWLSIAGAAENPDGAPFQLGDANLDGLVDALDFIAWNDHKFSLNPFWCRGDFDGSAFVDGIDWTIWNSNRFSSPTGFQLVPEPTSILMLTALIACVPRRSISLHLNTRCSDSEDRLDQMVQRKK